MAEFKFPDEKDDVKVTTEDDQTDEQIIIDVEDNTPEEDRGKPPLPDNVKEELYNDELEDYSSKVKKKLIQMKKLAHEERREKDNAIREQQEAITFAQKVMQENQRLKSNLNNSEKNVLIAFRKLWLWRWMRPSALIVKPMILATLIRSWKRKNV